ncbi:Asd/ArgC dimerization domain-containing protein [Paraburkholderia sp. BR14262]|uniref:Asd/ArgC dimerization domain-containing protein n=1 Tax=unclassified Paraburkholderia TaxID=2615204 RepID=UPI0034CF876C
MRVPILRAHAVAITVELSDPVSPDDARAIISRAEGLRLVDDRPNNHFPMPSGASGQNNSATFATRPWRSVGSLFGPLCWQRSTIERSGIECRTNRRAAYPRCTRPGR